MNLQRITHDVQQGTGPWLRLREGFDTASEAPAALGVGKYVTRSELLRQKHTGLAPEHSQATLAKFRAGHEAEASARPMADEAVGGELYPVTMSVEVAGLRLLASLDGLTLDGDTAWETKLWNEELAAHVRAGTLPGHYTVQMDQELLVSGAARCLFTCTDGTPERFVSCWYEADPSKFEALIDGWIRFHKDLEAYVPQDAAEPAHADPMESLPTVSVRLDGELSVAGNLPAFAEALRAFVDRIPKKPTTDNEFATTEAACKALKRAEEALDAAESGALASIADVEAMRRAIADCRKLSRDTRLAAEKMVERRKVEIKEQAVMKARRALDAHVAALNAEIAPMALRPVAVDFAGSIKGLRTEASLQDALDTALAGAKIAADAQARGIRANVAHFQKTAVGMEFLFADLGQLVHKSADDFEAVLAARIRKQLDLVEAQQKQRQADEARRIAEAEQRAREQEAARIANEQRQQSESARLAALAPQFAGIDPKFCPGSNPECPQEFPEQRFPNEPRPMPFVTMSASSAPTPAPRVDEPATLKLGTICERLGFTMTAGFLADTLGIRPARTEGAARLYRESDFGRICAALQWHIERVYERSREEVAV